MVATTIKRLVCILCVFLFRLPRQSESSAAKGTVLHILLSLCCGRGCSHSGELWSSEGVGSLLFVEVASVQSVT